MTGSGSACQTEGFGVSSCSATKRSMAACGPTTEPKTPWFRRRRDPLGEEALHAFGDQLDVCVKWKVRRG